MEKNKLNQFKATVMLLVIIASVTVSVHGQNKKLINQLEHSKYLSKVMKIDSADAGMTRWIQKKVEKSRVLPLADDFNALKIPVPAAFKLVKKSKDQAVEVSFWKRLLRWLLKILPIGAMPPLR
ncbi:MAG TPA: hypothetical protein VLA03_05275 [Draconibacterium sp.]|nr:hypothetical protein [Draconibacterium sp.]